MHLTNVALLALMALGVTGYPQPSPKLLRLHPDFDLPHERDRDRDRNRFHPRNTTLSSRASNGLCSTLELPTEATYKLGYTSFCTKYVPADRTILMHAVSSSLVATYMLPTHAKTTILWIFKIHGTQSGYQPFYLTRDKCLRGFRDLLESERAKMGTNWCVVQGSGGEGESKEFWGQGFVLAMGGSMLWIEEDGAETSRFESRRRKGEFDPNGAGGKD